MRGIGIRTNGYDLSVFLIWIFISKRNPYVLHIYSCPDYYKGYKKMREDRLIYKIIKSLEDFSDGQKVTTVQVHEAINACSFPQKVKAALIWLSAWTLKKRGIFYFLRAYLVIGGTWIITRPSLWAAIIKHFFDDGSTISRLLLSVVDFFDGFIDHFVFVVLTAVVILVITYHFIILFQKTRVNKQLVSLLNEICFNPEKEWFDKKCKLTIAKLGERYSSEINFKNIRLNSVYKALTNPDYWDKSLKKALQEFVKECRHTTDNLPVSIKIEKESIEHKVNQIIEIYNNKQYDLFANIFEYSLDVLGEFHELSYSHRDIVSYSLYEKIAEKYSILEDFQEICQLYSKHVLYIKGEAGTGKSHLLADIVNYRMNRKLKSLFALGLDFNEIKDVKDRLLDIWCVKGTWDDFLLKLDKIAELEKHRIYIFLDGINEGLGSQLWPSTIGELEADILQYDHLGLVVSARTFSNTNILDKVSKGKASITLEGFKGMEDEAIAYLTGKFGVTLPNISKYKKEFSNPLFLKLYCKAYNSTAQPMPKSFLDIVKNYISMVNEKLSEKYDYQAVLYNYAQKVADALTDLYVNQDRKEMVKFQGLQDLLAKAEMFLPQGITHKFIQDLISEGVLMSYSKSSGDILVDFNFDIVGDYLCAAKLIEKHWTEYSGRIMDNGIYEATSVLLPLMKGVEIVNYTETNLDQPFREYLFEETLKQRFSITDEAIDEINKIKAIDLDLFYEIVPVLTTHPECSSVFSTFNKELKAMSMVDRDMRWSMHFTIDCAEPSRTELVKLSSWAASLGRKSAQAMSDCVSYQMACLMCWGFTSPYRLLRDMATKGVINLLRDKPQVLSLIVDLFDDVNDPYIQQRLYAVVHGCVFRGDCCMSEGLGQMVYDKVFKNDPIRTDILLRDYARCAVDYISQHVSLHDVSLERIKPPYGVIFDISSCPDRDTVEQKYRIDAEKSLGKDAFYIQRKILDSMETEYSNGTGGYGDFGRYTFEASMHGWKDCEGFNAPLLRNYALDLIFEKYHFDASVYVRHDSITTYGRGGRPVMERFGKKFQWIAMYEILGLLQDNYKMEPWENNMKDIQCEGSWDPHVRDIDTTNGFSNYYNDEPLLRDEEQEWLHISEMPFIVKNEKEWLHSKEGLSKDVVKESIEVHDESDESWIVLYGYNTMTPVNNTLSLDEKEIGLWEFLQAYIVPREYRNKLTRFINKTGTQGRGMNEYRNNFYELFYKDYYSSASYRDYAEWTKLDNWSDLKGSNMPFMISYLPYSSEGELSVLRLNKLLFEYLELKDGDHEGEYVDEKGKVIAFDPSVRFQNDVQLVVRKKELVYALNKNHISLVWPILFEKQVGTSIIGNQMGGSAYITNKGKIKVKLRSYDDRREYVKHSTNNQRIFNYAKLIWYSVTFNKVEKARIRMKLKLAKMYEFRES